MNVTQRQPSHQLFRQVAADTIAEDRHLGVDVDAGLEGWLRVAVLVDAAVGRAYSDDAFAVHEDVLTGEPGKKVDTCSLNLTGKPSNELIQRNDVVAVILQRRRDDGQRDLR
jgi:hypothetical protein